MTNEEFLREIFDPCGGDTPFTCAVPGDPTGAKYPYSSAIDRTDTNNFFCVSSIVIGDRRTPANCRGLHVLVVDDVGTKIAAPSATSILGVPTYVIETSPDNYQWGYVLDQPEYDPSVAQGLVEAMCREFSGDTAGRNRLVRLPVGVNGKAKYGTPSPSTRLVSFGGTRYSVQELTESLRAEPVEVEEPTRTPYLPAHEDPIVLAYDSYVKLDRGGGIYDITCPWVSEHTDGRDDGTVYIAPAGFKCHHGHCSGRTFADLREFLGYSAKDIDRWMKDAALREFTGGPLDGSAPSAGETVEDDGPVFLDTPTVARFHKDGRLMTEAEGEIAFPRQWVFDGLVTANGMWLLAGQGGLGKSRLALAVAMSAATGIPFGEFRPANKDGVKTLFMTQEDDDAEKFHRYRTQLLFQQTKDPRWKDPETLAKLEKNLYLPEIDPTEGLSERLQLELIKHQRDEGAFGLVIYDPLILFWQGEEDAGLNSAQGARDTLNILTKVARIPAKEQGKSYSVCFVHHLNKSGTVLGSVMVENLVRTVFKLSSDEAAERTDELRARLSVDKSNGVALRGREVGIKLHKPHAVVEMLGEFEHMTDEKRVLAAIASGDVMWVTDRKKLRVDLIDAMIELGDTKTERAKAVDRVLAKWDDGFIPEGAM